MAEPRVPGGQGPDVSLPCGEVVDLHQFDVGMREFACRCGESHAVVTDVHPPTRFFPDVLVEVLESTVETDDEFESFGTPHLMGMAMEEFPEEVTVEDASEDGEVGYSILWVTGFDGRRLHEVLVELVVELMEHALSHADDDSAVSEFEREMLSFDPTEFVEQYRDQRDFDDEFDSMA